MHHNGVVVHCCNKWNQQVYHLLISPMHHQVYHLMVHDLPGRVKKVIFHCEFTVRCKHLTLWDLQLSPADLTPMQLSAALEFAMEAPQLVVYHHKLWTYAAGVPPAAYCDEQQVYHLLLCCYSFCWPQKVYHLLLVRAKARKRKENKIRLWITSSGCNFKMLCVCCVF